MRLSLNNWPPLVSHAICFMFGIGFASFPTATNKIPLQLPSNSLIYTVSSSLIIAENPEFLADGNSGSLVQKRSNKIRCKYHTKNIQIISVTKKNVSLKIPTRELGTILEIIKTAQKKRKQIVMVDNIFSNRLDICSKHPRISYAD